MKKYAELREDLQEASQAIKPWMMNIMVSKFFAGMTAKSVGARHVELSMKDGYTTKEVELGQGRIMKLYIPDGVTAPAPTIFAIHGGGFMFPDTEHQHLIPLTIGIKTGCIVAVPEYRLMGTGVYPLPFDDCWDALMLLMKQDEVDTDKIIVYGDSAGGTFAAGVALKARDNDIKLFGQMLVYPTVDGKCSCPSIKKYWKAPVWNGKLTKRVWKMYCKGVDLTAKGVYASPIYAQDFSDLPKAYIEVNEVDSLHDEGVKYGHMLNVCGTECSVYENKGCFHGFDSSYGKIPFIDDVVERRCKWVKKLLSCEKQ